MAGPVGFGLGEMVCWWVCGWDVWMHGRMGHEQCTARSNSSHSCHTTSLQMYLYLRNGMVHLAGKGAGF